MMEAGHVGLPYRTVDDLLQAAIPYVRSGISAGDAVLVVTTPANISAFHGALDGAARDVEFIDASEWYDAPARAFTRYMRYWDMQERRGKAALRVVGEPIAIDTPDEYLERWMFFENALNGSVASQTPFRMMCTYDLRNPLLQMRCVEVSHPFLACAEGSRQNPNFIHPEAFAKMRNASPLRLPEANVQTVHFDRFTLCEARAYVEDCAKTLGLHAAARCDLVLAAGEALANAVEHGGGRGTLQLFATPDEAICDVAGAQGDFGDPARGYARPAIGGERGRGLWIMRQLCDWVEVRPRPSGGTIVRMHKRFAPTSAL